MIDCALLSEPMIDEVVVVDDASQDNSAKVAQDFLARAKLESRIANFVVMKNWVSKFETFCDDLGIRRSRNEIIILVQGDMLLRDKNFVGRAALFLEKHKSLFLISGRGSHSRSDLVSDLEKHGPSSATSSLLSTVLAPVIKFFLATEKRESAKYRELSPVDEAAIFPSIDQFRLTKRAGQLGDLFGSPLEEQKVHENNRVWSSELVFRGPLVFQKSKYLELGGFDKRRFFLGFDDHDLAAKGWLEKRWICGYLPSLTVQILEAGATRKSRNLRQQLNFRMRRLARHRLYRSSSLNQFMKLRPDQLPIQDILTLDILPKYEP